MQKRLRLVAFAAALTGTLSTGAALPRSRALSFAERVDAQRAIERVYYSHQEGATQTFDLAFPRSVLEARVRNTLQESAALNQLWDSPVTSEALKGEWERIARHTRLPERLQEITAALNHDPFLIAECFARASLVDRLARSFFAGDQRIHAPEREEAERLRDHVPGAGPGADGHDSRPSLLEGVINDPEEAAGSTGERSPTTSDDPRTRPGEVTRRRMTAEEFRSWRAQAPEKVGEVGPVTEEREAFVFRVVVDESPGRARIATYTVPKLTWDAWWEENRGRFREEAVLPVASVSEPLLDALPSPSVETALRSGGGATSGSPSTPAAPNCRQASWDNGILDDFPDPRSRHTAVWTGSQMIIWGGSQAPHLLNTGWKYDPLTDSWTPVTTVNAPSPRNGHRAVWTGTEMIVWGGGLENTGGRYNPTTDSWLPTSTVNAPVGRSGHSAIWTGTEMIVWGGGHYLNSGGRYNPATDTWTPTATDSGEARTDHSAVWTGSVMLIWGGFDGAAITYPLKYDPAIDTWTRFSTVGQPPPRYRAGAVWTGSRMVIWGGYNGSSYLSGGGQYDPATDTWGSISSVNAPTADGPSSFWTGSEMIAWATDNVSRYNPATDVWTTASAVNKPSSRGSSGSVWTGSQLIVWGGTLGSTSLEVDTGGRYTLATDSWTPTTSGPAPAARYGHSATWTGNEMIVWGGYDGANYLNTGGRYNPLTDSWTATSITNAPTGRSGHSAVWTGQLMVVWGQGAPTSAINTGGRYNPSSDTWTPTSTATGVPSPRFLHTAVWTGSRMIVWGGRDDPFTASYLNTGGIYNPATDSWIATSTTGAPSGRTNHTAVWSGSRMIIWGGTVQGSSWPLQYTNTGGSFNPQNNHWSSISSTGAPVARALHSAVWTGSEMVIWGGAIGVSETDFPLHSGGRYNSQTDSWTPTTDTNAPLQRFGHTAVWTGTEMVVWGGQGGEWAPILTNIFIQNTGGAYDPAANSWTTVPKAGGPVARQGHTAIWDGTRMIVWGGLSNAPARSGGRLRFDLLPDIDADLDGYGVCSNDCNDEDPSVHPGATEICNHIDDNCAGGIDEPFDLDQDGFSTCDSDCNDSNPAINPAAPEVCNHINDNCLGGIDEGFPDQDGDGWAACVDCNDFDATINPGRSEICNGVDDNCNSVVDEGGDALCPNSSVCNPYTCAGASGCQSNPKPTGTPCDDNSLCTSPDACNGSGVCVGTLVVNCQAPDDCHFSSSCRPIDGQCNPFSPKPNGTACNDGNACTMAETCQSGVCQGGVLKDLDADSHVDSACGGDDCNDADPQTWLPPMEVTNLSLTMSSPSDPAWDAQAGIVGPGVLYDLTSGTLTGAGIFDPSTASCLASMTSANSTSDARPDPAAGTGFWYLARARNSCGIGTYGVGTGGAPRSVPACP